MLSLLFVFLRWVGVFAIWDIFRIFLHIETVETDLIQKLKISPFKKLSSVWWVEVSIRMYKITSWKLLWIYFHIHHQSHESWVEKKMRIFHHRYLIWLSFDLLKLQSCFDMRHNISCSIDIILLIVYHLFQSIFLAHKEKSGLSSNDFRMLFHRSHVNKVKYSISCWFKSWRIFLWTFAIWIHLKWT